MDTAEFRERMIKLLGVETEQKAPHWSYWRKVLRDWVIDPANDPANFYNCPAIYHTMLWRHHPETIAQEYGWLLMDKHDFETRWSKAIVMPTFSPVKDFYKDTQYSQVMIHQAYHIYKFEHDMGLRVDNMNSIIEFGGGFGQMALALRRLGFNGEYICFDLPEFSLLQEYWLSQNRKLKDTVLLTYPDLQASFMPFHADLLIACYSLSEVEYELRKQFLQEHPANSYLFLITKQFADYDNYDYFTRYIVELGNYQFSGEQVKTMPDCYYFMAKKV